MLATGGETGKGIIYLAKRLYVMYGVWKQRNERPHLLDVEVSLPAVGTVPRREGDASSMVKKVKASNR